MSIQIREERDEDFPAVARVLELAFGGRVEAMLVEVLRAERAIVLALLAELEGDVVGHIVFSPVAILDPRFRGSAVGLAPLAVTPARQRSGIGSMLVREGLRRCGIAGHRAAVVFGHPEYYPRFGFLSAERFGLTCEFPAPPGVFQVLELEPGALDGVQGHVTYQPAFRRVG